MVPSAIPAIKTRPLFRFNGALPAELSPYVGRGRRARTSDFRLGRQSLKNCSNGLYLGIII